MTDRLTREQRSALMSRVRGRNTRPELAVRKSLRRLGVRFRSYARIAGTTVDFVLPGRHAVILVHGCFWHGCRAHYKAPKSSVRYWTDKIAGNMARDRRQIRALKEADWRVFVVWSHSLRGDPQREISRRLAGKR